MDLVAQKLAQAQMVFLPGGFSGGDEPDGSAKLITSFFRAEKLKDQVHDLLKNRDGLMLGICNGFQALIKLGLVPYGEIVDTDEHCPTLTFNTIGRHQSRLVHTRVASNKSPWLMNTKPGGGVHRAHLPRGGAVPGLPGTGPAAGRQRADRHPVRGPGRQSHRRCPL